MAILTRMQVLYDSKIGTAQELAQQIGKYFKCKCDQVPPAYPCENQKIIVIVFEGYAKMTKPLYDFCRSLSTKRSQTACLVAVSNGDADFGEVKSVVEGAGLKVVATKDIVAKKGMIGKPKLTDADIQAAISFVDATTDKLIS